MEVVNKFPFELNLQRTIIKIMMKHETFFMRCLMYLKEEYFENQYLAWLYRLISEYFKTYQSLPSEDTVRNEILKFEVRERIAYEKVFEDVLATEYKDLEYLYHELTAFAKRAYFLDNIKRIVNLYNEGNRNNAYRSMADVSKELVQIDFEQSDLFDYSTLFPLLDSLRSPKFRIPLGVRPIDEMMQGGLPRGRLLLFLGGVSRGKSMILANVARNFIEKDKKVLFLSLENPDDEQMIRFLGPMTGIPRKKFETEELLEDEKVRVMVAKERMEKYLMIKHWYKESLTIDEITNYCRMKHAMSPFDALVIDYVQMIKHKSSDRQPRDMVQGDVVQRFESLARELKVSVVSAVQSHRSGVIKAQGSKGTKDLLRVTDVGESFAQIKIADIIITVTVSDDDFNKGVMRLLLDKHRGGERGLVVECKVDTETAKVFSPDLTCKKLEWAEETAKKVLKGGGSGGGEKKESEEFLAQFDEKKTEEEIERIFS